MRQTMNLLLLAPLLLTASCLPTDPLASEGSGDDLMLSDAADVTADVAADPEVLMLEVEDGDGESPKKKDELFNSLADLLKTMQTLKPKPSSESNPESILNQGLEPDVEPQPDADPGVETEAPEAEPDQGVKTEPEVEAEGDVPDDVEEGHEQEEHQTGPDPEESEQGSEQNAETASSEQDAGQTEQEDGVQNADQKPSGTERPDSDTTTVFTLQLLDVPVASEAIPADVASDSEESDSVVPNPVEADYVETESVESDSVDPESPTAESDEQKPKEAELADPESANPESADPESAGPESAGPDSNDPEPVTPEPEAAQPVAPPPDVPEETPTTREPEPVDEPLEQNEVPLPAPARTPVEEPLIIAEHAACLGCVTPILQDGADLRRVANMAAKQLEEELDSKYTFKVTEVYRASKQVVNGIKYFLTLEVAPTTCERPLPPFTLCFVASDAERMLYAVELLHQPHRANTELLNLRQVDRSEIGRFGGLFAAATAEPATEVPHRKTAPIAPGDSLLDILMGLDSVISKQRDRQAAGDGTGDRPAPPPLASGPPPPLLQMDVPAPPPLIQAERAGPPPLQAEPPLQSDWQAEPALGADWQAEVQQRHSASHQAQRVQALLREAGWGPGAQAGHRWPEQEGTRTRTDVERTGGEAQQQEEEEETGCRESRQYKTQNVPLNVAHPRVQKILHKFLESQERSGSQRLVITDIRSATQQTISEINYRFEFVLGVSECLKNSTAHRYSCSATSANPLSNCRVRARHRPGKPLQFNTISCTSSTPQECANGHCQATEIHPYAPLYVRPPQAVVEVDIHEPTYQQLVQHVQSEVNRRSRRPLLKKFIKTLNATKVSYNLEESSEIIDQELYSLTLRFVETGCERADDLDVQEGCLLRWQPVGDASSRQSSVCDVRVSSLGWADRMRVLDLFCETEVPPEAA